MAARLVLASSRMAVCRRLQVSKNRSVPASTHNRLVPCIHSVRNTLPDCNGLPMKRASLTSRMNRHQKILCAILLPPIILAVPQIFGPKNFCPAPEIATIALYLSAFVALAVSLWAGYLLHTGKITPAPHWYSLGRAKKCLTFVSCPLLLWSMCHLSFGYTIPRIWTMLDSETRTVKYQVTKYRGGGRHSCSYQLENDHLDRMYFEICVPRDFWYRMPDRPFIATFKVEQSSLGMAFKGTRDDWAGLR